jgi:tRNA_anti-like
MKGKKNIRIVLIVGGIGILVAGGIAYSMFNKPHKDVQSAKTDYTIDASQLVNEYLRDSESANEKYLNESGTSKILEVVGTVESISEDFNNQKVILLKTAKDKAGVSATFTVETNISVQGVQIGDKIKIKGVIRSGASYDEDLGLYEHVILEKSDIIQ